MCYPTVKIRVLFFAKARELAGASESFVQLPPKLPYKNILDYLCRKFNLTVISNNIIIALNENYCEDIDAVITLKNGDEIAIIPPIIQEERELSRLYLAIKMNYLKLTKEKLDVGAISDCVADNSCGAISMFVGTTRDYFEEKKVLCLEYEAYEPMALKTMNKICDGMRSQWPDIKHIAIYHRLGTVPVKEASVVIAVSSPHRQTSLLSVQFAIDELKKSVPIWKKEQYDDSGAAWKENKECQWLNKSEQYENL